MTACPLCGAEVDPWLLTRTDELRPPTVRWLVRHHPAWRVEQGICPACVLEAANDFARTRSAFPLNDRTEPHTTFPYYHPEEETVLGLDERLPLASTFDGRGVTLAFLDSGYYPHPDLCECPLPSTLAMERLSSSQWRTALEPMRPRLATYVDLSGGRAELGLGQESLWDGQGVAWHGQMTTTIAAGNGALSGGRYRGPAPAACLLPIKIGRGDGHIPESDIREGFEWLLAERRWERYGVRVVNVSIGGDFAQEWRQNPVCLAAEALSARGVLVVAAAGNRARAELLAPAQAPSVLTVGGVDDANHGSDLVRADSVETIGLYPHNHAVVRGPEGPLRKPELLAPGRYLPSPILPVSPIFREMHAIARLRRTLRGGDGHADALLAHWQRVLHADDPLDEDQVTGEWMGEVWQAVRRRMNAHKWVHAAYQHVDGTSVSAAIVSGVAAQMLQANANLSPQSLRNLMRETALPLRHLPAGAAGAGLIQPTLAVAAALRADGGPLAGFPRSATVMRESELQKVMQRARVPLLAQPAYAQGQASRIVYFGLLAPDAASVAVIGDFDGWRDEGRPLAPAGNGWWHAALPLADGDYAYRMRVTDRDGSRRWLADPENPLRVESGYVGAHSRIVVD